jgi:hypothetical protein
MLQAQEAGVTREEPEKILTQDGLSLTVPMVMDLLTG